MNTIDDVVTNVTNENTVIDSAVTLIQGLEAQITALKVGTDPVTQAKIDALVTSIKAKTDALAAAVATGTPASTPVVNP